MGWVEARDQIVSIIEGTTPTMVKRGLPPTFKHQVAASADGVLPGARSFWLTIRQMKMKGQVTLSLPRWFRYECDIIIAYPFDTDPTLLFEAIAADHAAIGARLPDASLWGQPSSTIEGLFMGRDEVHEAEIDIDEDGVALVTYPITAECRQT